MKYLIATSFVVALVAGRQNACIPKQVIISSFKNHQVPEDSLVNINIRYASSSVNFDKLRFTYGVCNSNHNEQTIGTAEIGTSKPTKFVWATPAENNVTINNNLCIKAWKDTRVVGKSKSFSFVPTKFDYKDEDNVWRYDAVRDFKKYGSFVANNSPKTVGIVGAGMSGMFSALLLNQTNLNYKVEMIESNTKRIGGRIWTHHFEGGDKYDYHELGAMRLFEKYTFSDGSIKEDGSTVIVFRLINYLNSIIKDQKDKLELIPFVFGKSQLADYKRYHGWKQLDGGMSRLPHLLRKVLTKSQIPIKHGKVFQLNNTDKVNLKYKSQINLNELDSQANYDYAVVAVPLTLVRFWELPEFSQNLTDIINKQHIAPSCKVLLKFENKFWDSAEYSGQQYTNDKTVMRTTVYPSHGNSKVIIASYVFEDRFETQQGATIEEMEMLAIEELVKVHGEKVRHSYKKGNIKRHCWHLDPNSLGGFAHYGELTDKVRDLPPFTNMEQNTVFTVDSTDHRSGWIGGALNAGLRGVLQILVKDGQVDEARKLNQIWGGNMYRL